MPFYSTAPRNEAVISPVVIRSKCINIFIMQTKIIVYQGHHACGLSASFRRVNRNALPLQLGISWHIRWLPQCECIFCFNREHHKHHPDTRTSMQHMKWKLHAWWISRTTCAAALMCSPLRWCKHAMTNEHLYSFVVFMVATRQKCTKQKHKLATQHNWGSSCLPWSMRLMAAQTPTEV